MNKEERACPDHGAGSHSLNFNRGAPGGEEVIHSPRVPSAGGILRRIHGTVHSRQREIEREGHTAKHVDNLAQRESTDPRGLRVVRRRGTLD